MTLESKFWVKKTLGQINLGGKNGPRIFCHIDFGNKLRIQKYMGFDPKKNWVHST